MSQAVVPRICQHCGKGVVSWVVMEPRTGRVLGPFKTKADAKAVVRIGALAQTLRTRPRLAVAK